MNLRFLSSALFLPLIAVGLQAAPKLRLSTTAVGPVSIASGANGTQQVVEAFNAGDGSLNLRLTSNASWLTATTGAARACTSSVFSGTCLPIQIALNTSGLTAGTSTGVITVADPNAYDAPQTITVTVSTGGGVPSQITLAAPPGGTAETRFSTNSDLRAAVTTSTGANWLSLAIEGAGSFRFIYPYVVRASAASLPEGTYNGQIVVTNSNVASENRTVPVTFRVTSQPILRLNPDRLRVRAVAGGPATVQGFSVVNTGLGGAATTTSSGSVQSGTGPKIDYAVNNGAGTVTVNAAGIQPGVYEANLPVGGTGSDLSLPVTVEVVAQGAPVIAYRGAVNNATFAGGEAVAPGTIVAIFGEQFTQTAPAGAVAVPLPTTLGTENVRVLVNGVAAPLYYSSAGQINIQIPLETQPGEATVQVERGGQRSNTVTLQIAAIAPRLLTFGDGYAIAQNTDGTFARPVTPGIPSRPAKGGEVLVFYAIGLGQASPQLTTGAASPSSPPAVVDPKPRVLFGSGLLGPANPVEPQFVGLTPGLVGLYQLNVQVPVGLGKVDLMGVIIEQNAVAVSNRAYIAVE